MIEPVRRDPGWTDDPHREEDERGDANPYLGTGGVWRRFGVGVVALALLGMVLGLGGITGLGWGRAETTGAGLRFVIPAGSAARVAEPGIDSAVAIPLDIRFASGETAAITIRNDDTVAHRAGPFLVAAGQTYVQRFRDPGTYPIACAVDPAESIVVTVER